MELGHLRDDGMFEYKGRVYDRKGYIKVREEEIFKTDKILSEITDDISRLELIAERFSKIGSKPHLKENKLKPIFEHTINYLKSRSSEQVKFTITTAKQDIKAKIDPALFNWVIENLLRNHHYNFSALSLLAYKDNF